MIGKIYFSQVETDGPIKIGFTRADPLKRLEELQCGCPWELRLIGFRSGSKLDERWLHHHRFQNFRIRREWFSVEILPDVQEILASSNPWPIRDLSPVDLAIWRAGGSWFLERKILSRHVDVNGARRNQKASLPILEFLAASDAAA